MTNPGLSLNLSVMNEIFTCNATFRSPLGCYYTLATNKAQSDYRLEGHRSSGINYSVTKSITFSHISTGLINKCVLAKYRCVMQL